MKEKDDNAREIAKQAILSYLADGEAHRSSDMTKSLNAHNRERRLSKNTIYKYRAELIEDGLVEMKIGSSRDPRPRYKITEKGMEHYQKTSMLSKHTKELMALSRDEMVRKLLAYEFVEIFNSLDLNQRKELLEEWEKQGDPVAAKKLKALNEGLEKLRRLDEDPDARARMVDDYVRKRLGEISRSKKKALEGPGDSS